MSASTKSRSRSQRTRSSTSFLHKPHGVIHPRVQAVGPEHFAIIAVDPAKARSKWMMTDFYGNLLIPPTELEHNARCFRAAIEAINRQIKISSIKDVIVVLERTGKFHHPAKRAFVAAGFEVRIVHPFATKQFRQPADPDCKTDDTDLAAIFRTAVNGFGLTEPAVPQEYLELRTWARHRRDLVRKTTALRCQISDLIHEGFPGYENCFGNMFLYEIALLVPQHLATPEAIRRAGRSGIERLARRAGVRFRRPTIERILAWAAQASSGGDLPELRQEILRDLEHDRQSKRRQIARIEREMARRLVRTPYVRLLAIPGINVVALADVAGELGPIAFYAGARQITGRAGLYPRRYQSDQVDHQDGPLARRGNRTLRRALIQVADCLVRCNDHFRGLSARWLGLKKDKHDIRVRVADRFCRIAFQVVAGDGALRHPCLQRRHYIIHKLIKFYDDHNIDIKETKSDLDAAVAQLPCSEYASEAEPLKHEWAAQPAKRGAGAPRLGEILPAVLAKLGVKLVQSPTSGEMTLSMPEPVVGGPDNAVSD
jgi:transposase